MCGRFALPVIVALACATTSNAADVSHGPVVGGYGTSPVYGSRMEPVIVYDYEPGVIVRSYWEPPWRNHHYFPHTGRRPKVGRLERLTPRRVSKSEEYFRYWSASSFFLPDLPRGYQR
jgi:hypothetical protein